MGKYKILIFPSAKQDLQDIVDYLKEQSSKDAFKLYDELVDSIGLPMQCPLMKSSVLRAKGYRV